MTTPPSSCSARKDTVMPATSETVLDLLDALVRIDSVNPGLDPAGAGEAQIAAYIARWGRGVGLRVDVLEGTTGRPSVIVRGGRDHGGRRLLLCGHLDTVSLAGALDGLTPRVEGDRLYARGAYDMKAGLAAALIACRDAALAGPGNLHASLISGGTGESTIPDRCVFTVERRTLPGETLEHVEADIADLIERCRPADPRLTVNARTILHRPPMQTPATAPIVQAVVAAAGPGTSLAPMSYWADSAFIAAAGIPTVLYGPEGDGAHADIEWISRSGTSTASTVLTRLAQDFCS
jgi:acetylornithine deacetylase/succinyl-diaminopimelate desuccinylase-like protein